MSGPCAAECGRSPKASRISPVMIIRMIRPENRYVGTANDRPASLSPRRFRYAMTSTTPTDISSRYGWSAGTAEATAALPAATCTATVTT